MGPTLTIVTPMYNVEGYVEECLQSVLAQGFTSFEVLIVDDGSTDGSATMAESFASRDGRIRVIRQANAGQGPARNLALSMARGKYVVFVDSDDVVLSGAFRYLVTSLDRSGSDFAVAGLRRRDGRRTYRPSWSAVVHGHDRIGITIDDFPAAMLDVVAHHRIFRRRFWVDKIGTFPPGVYEDHVPMVAAYLRAKRFDILSRVTYEWRLRAEGTSTGQQKHDLENLRQRIRVKAEARELVWAEASPAVRSAWVGRVLDIDFPAYLEHALRADDVYRGSLQDALATYVQLADPDALAYVRVAQKIRTWLASQGAWADLEMAQRFFDEESSIPPTVVREGVVRLNEALLPPMSTPIPAAMLELSRGQTRLQVCLQSATWLGDGRLRLTGWAVIRAVDYAGRQVSLYLTLVAADGTHHVRLSATPLQLPEATEWVRWPHGTFDRAGFQTVIEIDRLRDASHVWQWHLRARAEVDGVVREGGVHHAVAGLSASRGALTGRFVGEGLEAIPRMDPEHGFTLRLQ